MTSLSRTFKKFQNKFQLNQICAITDIKQVQTKYGVRINVGFLNRRRRATLIGSQPLRPSSGMK